MATYASICRHMMALLLGFLAAACTGGKGGGADRLPEGEAPVDSARIYLERWQSGSSRDFNTARRIIEDYGLIGQPLDSVVKYLGSDFSGMVSYDVSCECDTAGNVTRYVDGLIMFIDSGLVSKNSLMLMGD